MKVSRDYISKLDSTEKRANTFGNLCMKKTDRFKKNGFHFFSSRQWGVDPRRSILHKKFLNTIRGLQQYLMISSCFIGLVLFTITHSHFV